MTEYINVFDQKTNLTVGLNQFLRFKETGCLRMTCQKIHVLWVARLHCDYILSVDIIWRDEMTIQNLISCKNM